MENTPPKSCLQFRKEEKALAAEFVVASGNGYEKGKACAVYFDQLSGAKCTLKLVKITFSTFFCKKLKKGRKSFKIYAKFGKKMGFKFAPESWSRVLFPEKKLFFC